MTRRLIAGFFIFCLVLVPLGCRQAAVTPTRAPVTIRVGGSDSMQGLARDLGAAYHETHSYVAFAFQSGNSESGLIELAQGGLDLALVSRNPRADELSRRPAQAIEIARDGIVVVVHPSNSLAGLNREQVSKIFSGEIINWSEFKIQPPSGVDSIEVVSREAGSGTRATFELLFMPGRRVSLAALIQPGEQFVLNYVASHPGAVGYASFDGWRTGLQVRALSIENIAPTLAAIQSGRYPLIRPLYLVVPDDAPDEAKQFVEFVQSAEGRTLIATRVANSAP